MKKFLSLLLALALCAGLSAPALAAGFPDVPAGHYAAAAVDACVAQGIVSGFSDGSFKPAAPVTRAQFCAMLVRAFYQENFPWHDTPENRALGWFVPYSATLYYSGPYGGTLYYASFEKEFADAAVMGQPIDRYDMAQLVGNILPEYGKRASDAQQSAAQAKIRDWSSVPILYQSNVASCYALGLLTGQSDGTFGGKSSVNRAQACVVIDRLAKIVRGETPAPSQTGTPAPGTSAADLEKYPELRCSGCGYLMQRAGSPDFDINGSENGGSYYMCDLCHKVVFCSQCIERKGSTVGSDARRHEVLCAKGGTGFLPVEELCSDQYKASPFYQRLKSVALTGNYRRDILAVAESQIGYTEGNNADQLDGSHHGRGDYSEYNWFFSEDAHGAWCSEFASWCARQAKIPGEILGSSRGAVADNFGGTAYTWNDTVYAGGTYTPQPGDLMLLCHSSRSSLSTSRAMDHTAIVESAAQNGDRVTVTVIDGNSNSTVRRHTYDFTVSHGLVGFFVAPDYD